MISKNKEYYTISEVADHFQIAPSVLRYWETQFKHLKPKKVRKRRYYTKKDIAMVKRIYDLLYIQKMTIEGAIREMDIQKENNNAKENILLEIKKDLNNILNDLKE